MTLTTDDLIGAWKLLTASAVFADGERRPEFGPDTAGYLSYSANGIVSAILGDMTRPVSGSSDPQRISREEQAAMAHGLIAYAGPYTVTADGTVIHHVDIALFTDWQGKPQRRHAQIAGNELRITGSPRTSSDGRTFHSELIWERLTP